MHKQIKNITQKGFTLTESLIVLSMFLFLASFTLFSLKPEQIMVEDKAFFTQLKADLYYAQTYAISHQQEILVVILPSEYRYLMYQRPDQPPLVERGYSKRFLITEGSIPLSFKFQPNGNISKFGTLFIYTKEKKYHITFLIGRGRFYVAED